MRWSKEKANAWYERQPWLVGCNFIPSTAINQLEMWQKDSFDIETIDRELGWASELGFNTVRVYLHDLLWQQDADGFKRRIDDYLEIARKHNIRTLLALFDDCFNDDPQLGKQPDPVPGLHNSGWLQSPGNKVARDPGQWGRLELYVKDMLSTYDNDERVLMWDLYNEPGNYFFQLAKLRLPLKLFKGIYLLFNELFRENFSMPLLRRTFEWAREANPSQPVTAGIYLWNKPLNSFLLTESDVISFHNYLNVKKFTKQINVLRQHGRPLICTEYMSRGLGSSFATHLPILRQENIACYN
jgi:hypothetical protein